MLLTFCFLDKFTNFRGARLRRSASCEVSQVLNFFNFRRRGFRATQHEINMESLEWPPFVRISKSK